MGGCVCGDVSGVVVGAFVVGVVDSVVVGVVVVGAFVVVVVVVGVFVVVVVVVGGVVVDGVVNLINIYIDISINKIIITIKNIIIIYFRYLLKILI